MLEYLYGKRFGSKIAWAKRKEGDKVGAGPRIRPYTVTRLLIGSGYFIAKPFPIYTPTFSYLVILHNYPPTKMEQTECSETLAYKIQTLGNYPEENIQHTGIIIMCLNHSTV